MRHRFSVRIFPKVVPTFLGFLTALLLGFVWLGSHTIPATWAAEDCNKFACNKDDADFLTCNRNKQSCLQGNIAEAQSQVTSLSSTISILSGQINLQKAQIEQTQAEIQQLEREIKDLSDRIAGLNISLDHLSEALVQRVTEDYKSSRTNTSLLFLASRSLTNFLANQKYLQFTRQQTAESMQQAEVQKSTFDQEKQLKEDKQTEVMKKEALLEKQQASLTQQQKDQQSLLQETQSNQAKYQEELQATLAEAEAIQAIIAGQGVEQQVRDVNEGDQIASIITGKSPCSTGTHLHFEVAQNGINENPAGLLKPVDVNWYLDGDDSAFSFSGAWNWPLTSPAIITQGYGMTYNARVRRAYGGGPHTGIDMVSKDGNLTVKAVKNGTLYRGSYAGCSGGGLLRYVRVDHHESGLNSYYLHINY